MKIQEEWRYETLPPAAQDHITQQFIVKNAKQYKDSVCFNVVNKSEDDLFALTNTSTIDYEAAYNNNLKPIKILWGTDNYQDRGKGFAFTDSICDMKIIRPRTEKSLVEQKKRVKDKAEVFTPSWVCNLQNNLIDESILGENAFNIPSADNKTWVSTKHVHFSKDHPWWSYVAERRIEMCCGEGPYLFSRYDTTTGTQIPVRSVTMVDGKPFSNWERIGVLDRKLRVCSENCDNLEDWLVVAKGAMRSTFGYEWQGDNLFLARMNMLNTFFDYLHDFVENVDTDVELSRTQLDTLVVEIAEMISKQLWQMDGLKMVIPESCSDNCVACAKKQRLWHDGDKPVFAWGDGWRTFEELCYLNDQN